VASVRDQPVGQLFHTVTNGIRTMPAYASQVSVEDRWAIILYVRALQRSQHATLDDVPRDLRDQLH
jgi:mono/diheme cytochrome c family protein